MKWESQEEVRTSRQGFERIYSRKNDNQHERFNIIPFKFFQKTKEEGTLLDSCYGPILP